MVQKLILPLLMIFALDLNAQLKTIEKKGERITIIKKPKPPRIPNRVDTTESFPINQLKALSLKNLRNPIRVIDFDHNKMPTLMKGWLVDHEANIERQVNAYLKELAAFFQVKDATTEWQIKSVEVDELGMHHIKAQQQFNGVPVFAGELNLHAKNGRIEHVMGRGFPTPSLQTIIPTLSLPEAKRQIGQILSSKENFIPIPNEQLDFFQTEQIKIELVIFHEQELADKERLVYYVQAYENLGSYKTYFMDAHTGEIIEQYSNICRVHADHLTPPDGPRTAVAQDLNGIPRTINTYEASGNFFLINTTKPNFSASQSQIPTDVVGGILTLDARNKSPENEGFVYFHVANNDNLSWSDRSSVSAHYNANIAYDYFRNVHGRNSIDGSGGNLISIVNVTDENELSMDNAYWNGLAMHYGNGDTEFFPLAGALDVAGHEMSHGVVQTSANLNYINESGALNESFADIFAVMMDRDDYQIGEEVVTNAFPTGALRDLSNPNNGGSQLGDRGWQPKHVDEQYFGTLDDGGVHINSGIPNHAFYLFAEAVGKEKAEKVFYRALTQYLTRSSRFVDARNAVLQSAEDLYGSAEVNAAMNAFSQVGIGTGSGGNYTKDAQINPGDEFLIYSDPGQTKYTIVDAGLNLRVDPASAFAPISVPSVTDDGSLIYYVNASHQIAATICDWDNNTFNSQLVQDQEIWSNVAISKDGNRLAAVESAESNRIWVFDFNLNEWYVDPFGVEGFELYNPTFTEGISTGDARFADVLEFDISGEVLMYDVYSEITGNFGEQIGYWDIGFLNVWDNARNNWGDGNIFKLFSSLSEGVSVGNPTFSKNSPYIIAFDFIEANEYAVVGANIETGDLGLIYESASLGYPSFSGTDNQLVFSNETTFDTDLFLIDLDVSKILPIQNSEGLLIEDAKWGVVFRNGSRILSDTKNEYKDDLVLKLFPNPARDKLNIEFDAKTPAPYLIQIFDASGRLMISEEMQSETAKTLQQIDISTLFDGLYTLSVKTKDHQYTEVFNKN
ncbi:M4 family metallopeptidase [Portibacter marinus]|uniref:M4 family metallopeptidase n=1 Tax=Portibacter marinus TaxID=2898660 RepID=UPI001F40F19E|nr:M4 family metallopeptidase [Portibacter marinus]